MGRVSGTEYWSNQAALKVHEETGMEAGEGVPEILIIVWKDAYEEAGWEDLDAKECLVTSIGFDGGEKNGYQMLYGSYTEDMTGAVLRIPIETIKEIRGSTGSTEC